MGAGLYVLLIASYIDLRVVDFFNPGPVWIVVAILPAMIAHYVFPLDNDESDDE